MYVRIADNIPLNIPVFWDITSGRGVNSGEYCWFHLSDQTKWSGRDIDMIHNREVSVYAIGGICYRDKIGRIRETAFCRRFNPDTNRFEREENSDYEYED